MYCINFYLSLCIKCHALPHTHTGRRPEGVRSVGCPVATTGSSERIVSKTSSSLNCGSASPVTAALSNDVLFYFFSANMFVVTNIVVVIQKHLVSLHGTSYIAIASHQSLECQDQGHDHRNVCVHFAVWFMYMCMRVCVCGGGGGGGGRCHHKHINT